MAKRLTFGPNPAVLAQIGALGATAWIDSQLNHLSIADPAVADATSFYEWSRGSAAQITARGQEWRVVVDLPLSTALRAVISERQLFERTVGFWWDHLNVDVNNDAARNHCPTYDSDVIRTHALGKFSDLLAAAAKSGAMLNYLDQSTSRADRGRVPNENYARELMEQHRPTGPRVAFLTGCLMEAAFREINFATVRVLIENNVQVVIPEEQTCCGAFQEHTGLPGVERLHAQNRRAFLPLDVDAVVSNSSGCGYSLGKSLAPDRPVRDVLAFLGELGPVRRERPGSRARLYVDLPCHLVHGQKSPGIPQNVLDATGYHWELAPNARDCCGSGGVYNIQKPENARAILAGKSAFLNEAEGAPVILGTSNHVCMMQWHSAGATGLVTRPYEVRHVIQLLDPGAGFAVRTAPPAKASC